MLCRGSVSQWDTYFHQYEPVYTKVPVMMCPGCVDPSQGGQDTFKPLAVLPTEDHCCLKPTCVLDHAYVSEEQWVFTRK